MEDSFVYEYKVGINLRIEIYNLIYETMQTDNKQLCIDAANALRLIVPDYHKVMVIQYTYQNNKLRSIESIRY
jgi:hypothetical protein